MAFRACLGSGQLSQLAQVHLAVRAGAVSGQLSRLGARPFGRPGLCWLRSTEPIERRSIGPSLPAMAQVNCANRTQVHLAFQGCLGRLELPWKRSTGQIWAEVNLAAQGCIGSGPVGRRCFGSGQLGRPNSSSVLVSQAVGSDSGQYQVFVPIQTFLCA